MNKEQLALLILTEYERRLPAAQKHTLGERVTAMLATVDALGLQKVGPGGINPGGGGANAVSVSTPTSLGHGYVGSGGTSGSSGGGVTAYPPMWVSRGGNGGA